MPRRPLDDIAKLSVRIPRGHEGFWKVIRLLDSQGPWTIADVHGETNDRHLESVADYVYRLVRGGFAAQVGTRLVNRAEPAKLYRLRKRPADAPSLRRDGTVLPLPAQQRLWTAMRALKQFGVLELAGTLRAEGAPARALTVKTYCARLAAVGYLVAVSPGRPRYPTQYRLKPAMDSGPKAPKILRCHVVYDPNRNAVIGDGTIDAEGAQ